MSVDAVRPATAPCDWNHGFADPTDHESLSFAKIFDEAAAVPKQGAVSRPGVFPDACIRPGVVSLCWGTTCRGFGDLVGGREGRVSALPSSASREGWATKQGGAPGRPLEVAARRSPGLGGDDRECRGTRPETCRERILMGSTSTKSCFRLFRPPAQ